MNCTEKWDREKWIDAVVFCLLLAIYTAVMFWLFYQQTIGNEKYYHSDMKAYVLEMQGLNTKYSFPYPILFKFGAFIHLFVKEPEMCIAVATTVFNSLSAVFLKYYMGKTLQEHAVKFGKRKMCAVNIITTVAVFSVFFAAMLYIPGQAYRYRGVFSPNPFHNATYIAVRPFAIVSFFLFADLLPKYERETDWRESLLFGLFLLLTTLTKPSFTFILVSTAGVVMLYRLVRSRFRTFVPAVKLGICFLPTFCVLLYQFFGVFGPEDGTGEHGIGFGFALVWKLYSENIPLAIMLAAAFPILTLCFHLKDLKENALYRFSWQLYLMSLAQVLCLYEKGFRMGDMNFSWGYMHGLFFIFVSSVFILLRDAWEKKTAGWIQGIQWMVYVMHLTIGFWYFKDIFMGKLYY